MTGTRELTGNETFCLFFANGISDALSEKRGRQSFLAALKLEPERVQGLVLIQYDAVILLAGERGINPTFPKVEGLETVFAFLPQFFAAELAALPY